MLAGISGGRGDGTPWPPPGGELHVGDEEGRQLCAARLAVPVPEPELRTETATPAAADVEERATPASAAPPELPKRAPKKG